MPFNNLYFLRQCNNTLYIPVNNTHKAHWLTKKKKKNQYLIYVEEKGCQLHHNVVVRGQLLHGNPRLRWCYMETVCLVTWQNNQPSVNVSLQNSISVQ